RAVLYRAGLVVATGLSECQVVVAPGLLHVGLVGSTALADHRLVARAGLDLLELLRRSVLVDTRLVVVTDLRDGRHIAAADVGVTGVGLEIRSLANSAGGEQTGCQPLQVPGVRGHVQLRLRKFYLSEPVSGMDSVRSS